MNLVAPPAFTDNYIWMLHEGRKALVVDPGEAAPAIRALDAERLGLAGILVIHHHRDHVDGADELAPCTAWCEAQRERGLPTLPSPIARERAIDPFLRCDQPAVVQPARLHGANGSDGLAAFAALRQWKNEFR